ncbi:unnamed protein product, partial [Closterium sp. NIES-54]
MPLGGLSNRVIIGVLPLSLQHTITTSAITIITILTSVPIVIITGDECRRCIERLGSCDQHITSFCGCSSTSITTISITITIIITIITIIITTITIISSIPILIILTHKSHRCIYCLSP